MSAIDRVMLSRDTGVAILSGTGAPTGLVAPSGSIYVRTTTAAIYQYDGTTWVQMVGGGGGGGALALNDLSDVVITASASGDILRHNGTNWVDAAGIVATDITSGTVAAARLPATTAYTDVAQTFTKPQRGAIATLVSAANLIAVDLALSDNFKITLAQNNTLSAPTNVVEGQSGVITFTQDGTGSRTMAYNAFWDFAGAAPALSTVANAIDHLSYYVEPGAARARVQLSKEAG